MSILSIVCILLFKDGTPLLYHCNCKRTVHLFCTTVFNLNYKSLTHLSSGTGRQQPSERLADFGLSRGNSGVDCYRDFRRGDC